MNLAKALSAVVFLTLSTASVVTAEVDIRVRVAPPAVRIETPPPPPSSGHYWIGGHWQWERNRYVWFAGHWVAARPGEVWVRSHWIREGDEWVYRPGRWQRVIAPADSVAIVANVAPPRPKVEVMTAPPSANHFWIAGHWHWNGRSHEWITGHWEEHRVGSVWVPAHWVHVGHEWRFAGGHWQAY